MVLDDDAGGDGLPAGVGPWFHPHGPPCGQPSRSYDLGDGQSRCVTARSWFPWCRRTDRTQQKTTALFPRARPSTAGDGGDVLPIAGACTRWRPPRSGRGADSHACAPQVLWTDVRLGFRRSLSWNRAHLYAGRACSPGSTSHTSSPVASLILCQLPCTGAQASYEWMSRL